MKPKTKAFCDKLLSNPKLNHTEAYLQTHQTESRTTATNEASELLRKPSVQIYLNEHINKAKERVVELVSSDKEDIALRASDSILDRALGKPIQRQQIETKGIQINIDLTEADTDIS